MSYSYSRRIYGWFDLLGDLGGVTDVFVLIFTYFFAPISEFNFILEASKKLFMARTKTDDLFEKEKTKHQAEFKSTKVENEIKKHRVITISIKDSIYLFFSL
jgi:hypothetical protein